MRAVLIVFALWAACGQAWPVEVLFTPNQRQLIGVAYAKVERKPLTKVIRTLGRVEYDERKLAEVTLKISGWIKELYLDSTGKFVRRGQPLLAIYSPELVSAQEEYLLALRTLEQLKASPLPEALESARFLVEASRRRLVLWDFTPAQIQDLERGKSSRLYQTIVSPISGYVIEKRALKGQKVEPGMTLYKIADLSTVWVLASIYESDLPLVQLGQEATMRLSYVPGATWRGKVDYLYPYLEAETRTNPVRLVFPNQDLKLKPGMYARLEIEVNLGEKLAVPESAVLHSGERKLVFVDRGQGSFEPREVRLGTAASGYYEVLDGLQEGEQVAASGTFLIDSESKLKAAESMMAMMGQIGMGDWKMESAKPMEMEGGGGKAPEEKPLGKFKLKLATDPDPARVGDNLLLLTLVDERGQPVTDAQVALEYTMDMPGMMIDHAEASHLGQGVYQAKVRFTMAGPWGVTVSLKRPGQAEVRGRFTVYASLEGQGK